MSKLYTEEQVRRLYQIAHLGGYGKYIMDFEKDVKQLTPIELPSDEEIRKTSISSSEVKRFEMSGFELGAKWMREQILNQNK